MIAGRRRAAGAEGTQGCAGGQAARSPWANVGLPRRGKWQRGNGAEGGYRSRIAWVVWSAGAEPPIQT